MLYIVSTPIGNLGDFTFRAIEILKQCDVIIAEDSRKISIVLNKYDIDKKPIFIYKEFNEQKSTPRLVEMLKQGRTVALTTDAGTPGISDPGFLLVREALREGIPVSPIPGPCAFVSALVCSGLPMIQFQFIGFSPRKQMQKRKLFAMLPRKTTTVFYESPHRIHQTLEIMAETIPDYQVTVAREITKVYEEFIRGTAMQVHQMCKDKVLKGEISVCVYIP